MHLQMVDFFLQSLRHEDENYFLSITDLITQANIRVYKRKMDNYVQSYERIGIGKMVHILQQHVHS